MSYYYVLPHLDTLIPTNSKVNQSIPPSFAYTRTSFVTLYFIVLISFRSFRRHLYCHLSCLPSYHRRFHLDSPEWVLSKGGRDVTNLLPVTHHTYVYCIIIVFNARILFVFSFRYDYSISLCGNTTSRGVNGTVAVSPFSATVLDRLSLFVHSSIRYIFRSRFRIYSRSIRTETCQCQLLSLGSLQWFRSFVRILSYSLFTRFLVRSFVVVAFFPVVSLVITRTSTLTDSINNAN